MQDEITIFDSGNLNTFVTSVGEYLLGGLSPESTIRASGRNQEFPLYYTAWAAGRPLQSDYMVKPR